MHKQSKSVSASLGKRKSWTNKPRSQQWGKKETLRHLYRWLLAVTGSAGEVGRTAWTVTAYSRCWGRGHQLHVGSLSAPTRICRWTSRGENNTSKWNISANEGHSQSHQAVTTRFEHNFHFSFLWTAFPFSYWFFFLRCVTGHKSNLVFLCVCVKPYMS